jgi:hypothetical protein
MGVVGQFFSPEGSIFPPTFAQSGFYSHCEFVIEVNKQPCKAPLKSLSLVPTMSSQRLHGGLITLCLLLSCRLSVAVDPGSYGNPANPASLGPANTGTPGGPPAMVALPANTVPVAGDASSTRKFYTITAALRETYDDNVNTTNTNQQAAFETMLSPSILVDFPREDGDFSARYTFDITYYGDVGGNNGGSGTNNTTTTNNNNNNIKNGSFQYDHEFVAQYAHTFSSRFNFNVAEQFRYFYEPSLFENTGTLYQSGNYVSNILNGTVNAQWTPLFGTTTTYSNTVIRYDDANVALTQNSIENTGSQLFNFAVLPKVNAGFGGIVDDISYESAQRGYISYTAFIGGQWQILPSMSASARGGGSYTEPVDAKATISPYAAVSFDWSLGARSELTFSYAHEVTPTDQIGASGQTSDRFTALFRYDITSSISAHLQGTFTRSDISQSLITSAALSSYSENDYALDTGLTYHYNSYLSFETGILLSGVSSELDVRNYSRDEAYVGVRGTY